MASVSRGLCFFMMLFAGLGLWLFATAGEEGMSQEQQKTTESNMPEDKAATDKPKKKANRLLNETSPYLLQHAYNPVDWYPWGEEAIAAAKKQNKPIFLSIGYSACHWCHVMEHESFENEAIAAYMNEHYICVKVDREERPDVDQIYMNAVVAMTGRGGWPMSVFLRPDLKPFMGGTYWPPHASRGMAGFSDILKLVHNAWETRREDIDEGAERLTEAVQLMSDPELGAAAPLNEALLQKAMQTLIDATDREHGGFGRAPKFPHSMDLRLLLRLAKRFDNKEALEVATLTLDKMAYGGMYDQIGGGFHRYSTDERWLAPHFEKMLYDNALLTSTYLEAWQVTHNPEYERIVRESLDYILREMTHSEGGFYSTQDADSEGVEGKFFVWSLVEIKQHLGAETGELFAACYDVSEHGNWEETNILNRPIDWKTIAEQENISLEELTKQMATCRTKLYNIREKRIHPGRDEKILASWNGLMIAAMAQSGMGLNEPKYVQASAEAADFVWEKMRSSEGRLWHSWKEGQAKFNGYLDDYANLIDAFVDVYQATGKPVYLERANELADIMIEHFLDTEHGGFYFTSNDHEKLIARSKESQDNATPSGNSVAAYSLLKLGRLIARTDLEEVAFNTLKSLSGQFHKSTMASGQSLIALDFQLGPTYELVFVSPTEKQNATAYLEKLHSSFVPNKVIVTYDVSMPVPEILKTTLQGKKVYGDQPTLYQCEHGSCQKPAYSTDEINAALKKL